MKKTMIFGMVIIMGASTANAGWMDKITGKKAAPATLEEACSKKEISKICLETLLGDKTVQECLLENTTKLSKSCAGFITKMGTEKTAEVKAMADTVAAQPSEKSAEVKAELGAKKAEYKGKMHGEKAEHKAKMESMKAEYKNMSDSEKAEMKTKKQEHKKEMKDIKGSVKQTGSDLSEVGKSMKM